MLGKLCKYSSQKTRLSLLSAPPIGRAPLSPLLPSCRVFFSKKAGSGAYVCSDCGNETAKWGGQCMACKAWNTIKEVKFPSAASSAASGSRNTSPSQFRAQSAPGGGSTGSRTWLPGQGKDGLGGTASKLTPLSKISTQDFHSSQGCPGCGGAQTERSDHLWD